MTGARPEFGRLGKSELPIACALDCDTIEDAIIRAAPSKIFAVVIVSPLLRFTTCSAQSEPQMLIRPPRNGFVNF